MTVYRPVDELDGLHRTIAEALPGSIGSTLLKWEGAMYRDGRDRIAGPVVEKMIDAIVATVSEQLAAAKIETITVACDHRAAHQAMQKRAERAETELVDLRAQLEKMETVWGVKLESVPTPIAVDSEEEARDAVASSPIATLATYQRTSWLEVKDDG